MFSPITRSKEFVLATEMIVKTHLEEKFYYKYSKRKIKKSTIRVHCTTEKMSKLTVTLVNLLKKGLQ